MGLDAAWGTPKLYHSDEHLELWVSPSAPKLPHEQLGSQSSPCWRSLRSQP